MRFNESPVYVDLDIASANIAVPGCMSSLVVSKDCFLTAVVSSHGFHPRKSKSSFHLHVSSFTVSSRAWTIRTCIFLSPLRRRFKRCLHSLADDVETRIKNDEKAFHGGVIVNGGSWYKEDGSRPLLDEVITLLKIDLILVIHDDFIYV